MIVKSIIAGTVLAGLAGGGVYYGLSPDGLDGFGIERNIERPEPIAPKNVNGEKAANAEHPHTKKKSELKATKTDKAEKPKAKQPSEKKWINQYLDSEGAEKKKKPDTKTTSTKTISTTVVEANEREDDVEVDVDVEFKDEDDKKTIYKAVKSDPIIISDVNSSAEVVVEVRKLLEEMGVDEDTSDVIIAKTKIRIQADEQETETSEMVSPDMATPETATMESFETLDIIIREAEQIQSIDLKDRAYLSVVDYALAHGYFGEAKDALPSINQPELRETARSRIAVKYASTGNPDAAFGLVDSVELEDFKDPMRIQIIEALIGADPEMKRDK